MWRANLKDKFVGEIKIRIRKNFLLIIRRIKENLSWKNWRFIK